MWLAYVDQPVVVFHDASSASGTTILNVSLVFANGVEPGNPGTDVASEKSTSSSAVQPLNAFAKAFVLWVFTVLSFVKYTLFNEVQFLHISDKPDDALPTLDKLDKLSSTREVHPLKALLRAELAAIEVIPARFALVRAVHP